MCVYVTLCVCVCYFTGTQHRNQFHTFEMESLNWNSVIFHMQNEAYKHSMRPAHNTCNAAIERFSLATMNTPKKAISTCENDDFFLSNLCVEQY